MKTKFHKSSALITIIVSFIIVVSCNKNKNIAVNETYLDETEPDYGFKTSSPEWNSTIHLGRVLFYDKALSANNSVSCATCHKQANAFADNVSQSRGFENKLTERNSIAIQNLSNSILNIGFNQRAVLFWDGRESDLNSLVTKPISNHIEMGMDNPVHLIKKLNDLPYYKSLTKNAFGVEKLDITKLSEAMVMFMSQITSSNSRFDKSFMNNGQIHLSALEKLGQQLFNNTYQCNNCHNPFPGSYTDAGFANIGLDVNNNDKGRMNISKNSDDEGKFKVPDLHNVAITAPYMHDGRFNSLEEVLDHYSSNIKDNKNLDSRLKDANGNPLTLKISENDKKAMIAFLNSMTDYTTISNPNFSNPFKSK